MGRALDGADYDDRGPGGALEPGRNPAIRRIMPSRLERIAAVRSRLSRVVAGNIDLAPVACISITLAEATLAFARRGLQVSPPIDRSDLSTARQKKTPPERRGQTWPVGEVRPVGR